MTIILHLAPRADWEAAHVAGSYQADTLSTQGFIHCSTAAQVIPVADRFFRGQTGLVLLCIDTQRVNAEVKFEPPIDPQTGDYEPGAAEYFPHLYGPLNLEAVIQALDFPPNPDGAFTLPPEVANLG